MKNTSDRCVYSPEKKVHGIFFFKNWFYSLWHVLYIREIYALTELIWNKYKIEGFLRFGSYG